MDITLERLDEILLEHNFDESALIGMLQRVQEEAGYLPVRALRHFCQRLGVPAARVQALSTFYKSFSLVPTGRHKVEVCMGTACHIRGGRQVLERLARDLGVPTSGTTSDRRFTLESVRCLGCCSLAPVLRVGQKVYGRMDQRKAAKLLQRYE